MAYSIEKASPFIARTNDYARCRQAERKKFRFRMSAMDLVDASWRASTDCVLGRGDGASRRDHDVHVRLPIDAVAGCDPARLGLIALPAVGVAPVVGREACSLGGSASCACDGACWASAGAG